MWPEEGVELRATEPITLTFDQPMDRIRTELAVQFTPPTAGTLSWTDGQTLIFTPTQAWQAKTSLTLQKSATAITGLPMDKSFTFTLRTRSAEEFKIIGVVPQQGAIGTVLDSKIAVSFDRPVVPLMPTQEANNQPARSRSTRQSRVKAVGSIPRLMFSRPPRCWLVVRNTR
jgi:hypothetical protein